MISGEKGTIVKLAIRRDGRVLKINVERGLFDLEYCYGERIGKIGYIRLIQFYGEQAGSIENSAPFYWNIKKTQMADH